MPELPEVETTLRGINPHIQGKKVADVVLRQTKLRWQVNPQLAELLAGQEVLICRRRAKYLIISFATGILLIHLGMSGSLRIFTDGDARIDHPDKHDHVDIVFADGTQKRAVKLALMDNAVVVGVGNIYANESLFKAGISPHRPADKIKKKECVVLVETVKAVLQRAIETGGSTLRDFVNSDGKSGYFQQEYTVYGRYNEPCVRCGGLVQKEVLGQRGTFYCPNCQK